MSKAIEINKRANDFLGELSNILNNISYNESFVEAKYDSILECISMKIDRKLNFFEISIQPFPEIIGEWDIISFSKPLGDGPSGWIVINFKTMEIEEHNSDYFDFDLLYKVSKNEDCFLNILKLLAKYYKEYLNSVPEAQSYNPRFKNNIYYRRELASEFSNHAGGRPYLDFWKEYWRAWTDEEIFEAGPIGYDLDLPDTIKQEGDKYVWV